MVTILVSGSGTGVGKTRVTGALARLAARQGRSVQIIKPVQTGVEAGEPSDANLAAKLAGLSSKCAITLQYFPAPLAPLAAAKTFGTTLEIKKIIREVLQLPSVDVRLIEGAGGLAVPLDLHGYDWVEFAQDIHAQAVVLVVRDELGAINQSRLVVDYCEGKIKEKIPGGVFLNALTPPPPEVAASIRSALADCHVPVWGELAADAMEPILHQTLTELLGTA